MDREDQQQDILLPEPLLKLTPSISECDTKVKAGIHRFLVDSSIYSIMTTNSKVSPIPHLASGSRRFLNNPGLDQHIRRKRY